VLLGLRIVFITHIHSDHNLGLLDLISERNKILKKRKIDLDQNKLFLILPANVVPWYDSFCRNVENLSEGCQVIFIQSLRNEDYSFEGTMSKEKALNRVCSVKSDMVEEAQ
jgi:ribonuclease BN (tRNA processing enzyme)